MPHKKVISKLWGNLHGDELKKFVYLALGAFCLIGSFWPLKPLKESIFVNMVGSHFMPDVKMLTVAAVFAFVLVYSKIVDYFSKQRLIYAFLAFYVSVGALFMYLFAHPTIGLANTAVGSHRYIAWGFYLFVESYVTILMALYWSFVNDITSSKSAKKGYGMIVFGSQSGALVFAAVGKWMINDPAKYVTRVPQLIGISLGLFALLGVIVYKLTHSLPPEMLRSGDEQDTKPKAQVGILEGLRILITRPYVAGMFSLMFFQEVVMTLMNFQQARLVETSFLSAALRTNYYFNYTFILQIISCGMALFGTSYLHRRMGTRMSLISFPVTLLVCAGLYLFVPHLYVVTLFMILIKGLHYAFNQPVRESLYIPTSRDIKYKAKAWIDMIGMRGSKFVGAQLSKFIGFAPGLVGGFAIGLLGCWTVMARIVGRSNENAVKKNKVIS